MLAEKYKVAAWKTYTQWGPDGKGFFLDDDVGARVHREGAQARRAQHRRAQGTAVRPAQLRALDLRRHRPRGEALPRRQLPRSTTRASSPAQPEGPYDAKRTDGIDALVTSLRDNGIKPGRQRLRRARLDLALPDARSGRGRARHRQAPEVRRRGQRAVGHRLDLVRLAAGPDPGVPHVPDRAMRSPRSTAIRRSRRRCARRCSAATRCASTRCPTTCCSKHLPRDRVAQRARGVSRARPTRRSSPTGRRRGASSSRCEAWGGDDRRATP